MSECKGCGCPVPPAPSSPRLPGEECYVALDKGAITGEHVLVLPVEHYASSQAATAGAYAEMER